MHGLRPHVDSDNSLMSRFSHAALLASLVMLLFACPSPISTNLVLSVIRTDPPNGATKVDPGQAIVVSFNKDLDPSCLQQSPITVSPNTLNAGSTITLTFSYNSPTKKLSIEPRPFLERNSTYTVSFMTNLKDASGGTLPNQVEFAFTTGDNLAGDLKINGGSPYVTTTDAKVPLTLTTNRTDVSNLKVHIANSDPGSPTLPYDGTIALVPQDWKLDFGEGPKEVIYQFTDSITNVKSAIRTATVIRDTLAPTLVLNPAAPYFNKTGIPVQLSASANDANGISCQWSSSPSNAIFTPSATVLSPTFTPTGAEGPYTVTLTVTDHAGNTSAPRAITIMKDTVPPDPPIELGATVSPYLFRDGIKWLWTASTTKPNPYNMADTLRALLNGAAPDPKYLTPAIYGPITVESDGTYTLTVRQVDAAGNQSDPLSMPIIVTPVIPPDRSTTTTRYPGLQWRDFAAKMASYYKVHLWSISNPTNDLGGTVPGNMLQAGPYTLNPGQTYNWYIEWSLHGTTYYSPAAADTYYQFTVISK